MSAPAGYRQLPSGFWVRDDGSGPYFVDVAAGTAAQVGLGIIANYTTAELSALAAAGGLTQYAIYVASDTGTRYWATSESSLLQDGIATYSATEIDNRAGVSNIVALQALMAANCYPRRMAVAWSRGSTGKVVSAAVTFAAPWASPTNPSGNLMRIIQTTPSAHGMGASSDGKYLWVKTTAGVPTGFYPISTRASANQVDVDVGAANQPLIASTVISDVSRVTVYYPGAIFAVPAGAMGPNGQLSIGPIMWECSASTNDKRIATVIDVSSTGTGGTLMTPEVSVTSASVAGQITPPAMVFNQNSVSAQRLGGPQVNQGAAAPAGTVNTDAAFYCAIRMKTAVVDEYVELIGWRAEVTPLL